jgi:aspartokinase-like uncharacterized kinase
MRRVVKVGGSLLTSPTLIEDLRRWTAQQSPARTYFLPGGGALVDAIAEQQRRLQFDDLAAHWLCIRAMQIHFEMFAALMPECERVAVFDDSAFDDSAFDDSAFETHTSESAASEVGLSWLDPWALMQHDLRCAEAKLKLKPLPADWSVSSDSIAARAAIFLGAEELVLLKSTLTTDGAADYIDGYFEIAAQGIPRIRFVDLRDPNFAERRAVV